MSEPQDKRARFIYIPLFVLVAASAIAQPGSELDGALETASHIAFIVAGLAYAILELKDGHSLIRPSVTRKGSPRQFWVGVGVALTLAAIGMVNLWAS